LPPLFICLQVRSVLPGFHRFHSSLTSSCRSSSTGRSSRWSGHVLLFVIFSHLSGISFIGYRY
jgi:hypothetical protein